MDQIATIKAEIDRARNILDQAKDNYQQKPDDYSAQLLLLSMENYLSDLLQKLDIAQMQNDLGC